MSCFLNLTLMSIHGIVNSTEDLQLGYGRKNIVYLRICLIINHGKNFFDYLKIYIPKIADLKFANILWVPQTFLLKQEQKTS